MASLAETVDADFVETALTAAEQGGSMLQFAIGLSFVAIVLSPCLITLIPYKEEDGEEEFDAERGQKHIPGG
jgi:hypothetical protein